MRTVSRPLKALLAVAAGLAMSLALIAPASAEPAATAPADEATWTLSSGEQRLCIPAERTYWSYFIGFISGSWDTPLEPEVRGLPEGTVVEIADSIAPGDNGDRSIATIWIGVDLPPLDYGDYPAVLVVTDGSSTQTMDILIRAQERWGCGIG